jgi:hypothetical protein
VAATWPTDGYRRITAQLKGEGWLVNSKQVRRLTGELGFQGKSIGRKGTPPTATTPSPGIPIWYRGWR